jgi:nifR3 family TIM-barrel protein
MAGYTDAAFRVLCTRYGCGFTMTEVVNAQAILYGSKPTLSLLVRDPAEGPVGAHLYGSDPGVMAEAARFVEAMGRFQFVDLNAGCPVRKIVAKGAGAALIGDPARIAAIVAAIRSAVSLPVTVKTRIGLTPDRTNIREIAQGVEEAGAAAIAIHARYASNQHRGPANWDLLAQVKSERRLPVLGNGGIQKAGDALRMVAETGVDGVLIGRAAVGNPWIFEEVAALARGETPRIHDNDEHRAVILEHLDMLTRLKEDELRHCNRRHTAEVTASLHFRAHLYRYLTGFGRWADVRRSLNTIHRREQILAAVDHVLGPGLLKAGASTRAPPFPSAF